MMGSEEQTSPGRGSHSNHASPGLVPASLPGALSLLPLVGWGGHQQTTGDPWPRPDRDTPLSIMCTLLGSRPP